MCADDARVVLRSGRPLSGAVTLLDHHGDPLTEARTANLDGGDEPSVIAFTLPADVLASAHGIEGMHLHVDAPERWDFVSGVSVYRGGPSASASGSPFDVAFGSLATPSESRFAPVDP